MIKTVATDCLDKHKISYTLFTHAGEVTSIEQAASERAQAIEQVVRSILFRFDQNIFVMALINGKNQVSWPKIRQVLHANRLTLATEGEIFEQTGCKIGAVGPIGLSEHIKILIDVRVLVQPMISIGSGLRGTAIIIPSSELTKALINFEIVELV